MPVIDLSRLPPPDIIEPLDFEAMIAAFKARFLAFWADARAKDPSLPAYDVEMLETDPAVILGEAWSYIRLYDRARVNDAVRAVLAPLAKKADLDNVVAWVGIQRLEISPATEFDPAVMERDERLLRRYLLAFSRPAAGSADRYELEALTAWPECHDVKVNGRAIHGRRGDTDVVIVGPGGRAPTPREMAAVRAAITHPSVVPEGVSVSLLAATRRVYDVQMRLVVPQGASPDLVEDEARARIRKVAGERLNIGDEVPHKQISGAGFGPSVIRLRMSEPQADIPPDPYTIPVLGDLDVSHEVEQ